MKRKTSGLSLTSDSVGDDSNDMVLDNSQDGSSSIFLADQVSSSSIISGHEKESIGDEDDARDDYVHTKPTEQSPLLTLYENGKNSDFGDYKEFRNYGSSVPTVIYASPVKPYLPSPSTSTSRAACMFFILNVTDCSDSRCVFAV
jgi:hypothetical protein